MIFASNVINTNFKYHKTRKIAFGKLLHAPNAMFNEGFDHISSSSNSSFINLNTLCNLLFYILHTDSISYNLYFWVLFISMKTHAILT